MKVLNWVRLVTNDQQAVEPVTFWLQLAQQPFKCIDPHSFIVRLQIVPERLVTNFVSPGFDLKHTGLRILGRKFLVAANPISDCRLRREPLGPTDLPHAFAI